jgi:hypothetical protein
MAGIQNSKLKTALRYEEIQCKLTVMKDYQFDWPDSFKFIYILGF